MDSLQGQFLIAGPKLSDPNFFHTVVLIIQHNEDGALGLVLNRPTTASLQTIWQQVSEDPCLIEGYLHQGGPCEGPLMVLHGDEEASDLQVMAGVYFSTNKDSIEQLVMAASSPTKFFLGYAGWGAGQLEAEMEQGSWSTASATTDQIFDASDELWQSLHRAANRPAHLAWIPDKIMPRDPSMN